MPTLTFLSKIRPCAPAGPDDFGAPSLRLSKRPPTQTTAVEVRNWLLDFFLPFSFLQGVQSGISKCARFHACASIAYARRIDAVWVTQVSSGVRATVEKLFVATELGRISSQLPVEPAKWYSFLRRSRRSLGFLTCHAASVAPSTPIRRAPVASRSLAFVGGVVRARRACMAVAGALAMDRSRPRTASPRRCVPRGRIRRGPVVRVAPRSRRCFGHSGESDPPGRS